MLYGMGIVAIIAIMGGAIAFIGDKLGTRIGKRRMSIFGLRPRHTSIIVTIVTGILIAAMTLGILSAMSSTVRTALFGMEQLRAQMSALNTEISQKNADLEKGRQELDSKTKELAAVNEQVQATDEELQRSREARDTMSQELETVQEAYQTADQKLAEANTDIASLEDTRKELEGHISNLQVTTKQLQEGITQMRQGNVIFRVGQVLSGAVVKPGLNQVESEHVLANIVRDTNSLILRRLNIEDSQQNVLYVSRINMDEVAAQLAASKDPMTIRVTAAVNIIYGEPALAEIHAYPYRLIYHKGDMIWSETMSGGNNAQMGVLSFLRDVNKEAQARGVLPDPLSGDVGTVSGSDLFKTINDVANMRGPIRLEAVASTDTYSDGPVQIWIRIVPVV